MSYRKLGWDSSQRKAMLREMTTQLIINERIVTTEARAKEVRRTAEKMITLGKRGDLAARRKAAAFVRDEIADIHEENGEVVVKSALQKLFSDVAPRYKDRNGGYTRIMKLAIPRKGDAAPMVVLELV
ncbi:50S ribosomal protein L17 [Lactobacillus equicursoris DSM 19284 = JCM 14600 = CIP 110162]|uniref:Large ribosomal subunit protein bL17 n=3 Tax=Lactobacillus equicursoris TaxID=420645 RepID=K0NWS9_9LACO|nr:50S ribosomal protein L17 [Lactobacillus equicursoris]MDD6385978.1 50S ribosomal protein L17 [Lactobacillus equicursoris]MDD6406761.1 50S ribosomal protein L17 [Lactobacillus equicursoris]MST78976.1 50S ribosomal protein L17 [Lactobacillus equicursoris]CCK83558.1 50S ribosomal protein L17 [Lactobacillus equicursoris 66c]CCK83770.1 50S ribosomal protein L17 [Lactobacillus equicursoris 66c]